MYECVSVWVCVWFYWCVSVCMCECMGVCVYGFIGV